MRNQVANDEVLFLSLLRKQEPIDACLRRHDLVG